MKTLKEHLEEQLLSEVLPQGWNPQTGTQPPAPETPQQQKIYQQQKNPQPKPNQQAMAAYKTFQKGIQDDTAKAIQQITQALDGYLGELKTGILQNRPNWGERMQGFRNFLGNFWDELRGVRQMQQPVVPPAPPAPQPAAYGNNYNPWYGSNQPRRESVLPLDVHRSLMEHFQTLKRKIILLPLREAGNQQQQNPQAAPYAGQSWAGPQNSPVVQGAMDRGAMNQAAADQSPLDPRDVDQLIWDFRQNVLGTIDKSLKQLSYNAMTRMDQSMRLKQPDWFDDAEQWKIWQQAQQGGKRQPTPEEIEAANIKLQQQDYDQGGVPMELQHVKHLEKTLMELNLD